MNSLIDGSEYGKSEKCTSRMDNDESGELVSTIREYNMLVAKYSKIKAIPDVDLLPNFERSVTISILEFLDVSDILVYERLCMKIHTLVNNKFSFIRSFLLFERFVVMHYTNSYQETDSEISSILTGKRLREIFRELSNSASYKICFDDILKSLKDLNIANVILSHYANRLEPITREYYIPTLHRYKFRNAEIPEKLIGVIKNWMMVWEFVIKSLRNQVEISELARVYAIVWGKILTIIGLFPHSIILKLWTSIFENEFDKVYESFWQLVLDTPPDDSRLSERLYFFIDNIPMWRRWSTYAVSQKFMEIYMQKYSLNEGISLLTRWMINGRGLDGLDPGDFL